MLLIEVVDFLRDDTINIQPPIHPGCRNASGQVLTNKHRLVVSEPAHSPSLLLEKCIHRPTQFWLTPIQVRHDFLVVQWFASLASIVLTSQVNVENFHLLLSCLPFPFLFLAWRHSPWDGMSFSRS
jgi:hypothetical protein